MCLYIFAYKTHPDYPFILAGNRDEFYDRPTAPLNFWQDHSQVLGGRDLQRKGTWLGMTRQGRLAFLTNYREGTPPNRKGSRSSRGLLVSSFLTGSQTPKTYLEKLSGNAGDYAGFNLLVGDTDSLWYFSNRCPVIQALEPGVYGLSNHLLNTDWPKISRARSAFESTLKKWDRLHIRDYLQILIDQKKVADHALPRTGIELELERLLAPIFVTSSGYGTCSSAVIWIDNQQSVTFFEQTWQTDQAAPLPAEDKCFRFNIQR